MPCTYRCFALFFLCHVVGLILCVRVNFLGLERMLVLFWKSHAKGGVDFNMPQQRCCHLL